MPVWISWDSKHQQTIDQIEGLGGKLVVEDALKDVLQNHRVMLRSLTPGISGARVFRSSPVALNEDGTDRMTEVDGVLKVGPAHLLAKEVNNYRKFVEHVLEEPGDFARLDAPPDIAQQATEDPDGICAIHYRKVGSTTLGKYIAECLERGAVDAACDAMDYLLTLLRPWQEKMRVEIWRSLTENGVYGFKDDPFDDLEAICLRLGETRLDSASPALTTSADVARIRRLWEPGAVQPARMLQTAIHGDLHTDNVMVEPGGRLTLIDFGTCTGDGHFLRDICTLEAHLLLRALVPDSDEPTVMRQYLSELEFLYRPSYLDNPFSEAARSPLQAVIARLRRYALACLMNGRREYSSQYAIAVLRHAIRIVVREDSATTDNQRYAAMQVAKWLGDGLAVSDGRVHIKGADANSAHRSLGFLDGAQGRWADPQGLRPPRPLLCDSRIWTALAEEILKARGVDFLGLTPTPLIDELMKQSCGISRHVEIRYVTTRPGIRRGFGLGYVHPRWRASLTGMRNLVASLDGSELGSFARESQRVSENCLIRLTGRSGTRIMEVSRIHEATHPSSRGLFTLTELDGIDGPSSDWIERTYAEAPRLIIREVDCKSIPDPPKGALPGFTPLTLTGLETYGDPKSRATLRPIALTILTCWGPEGRQVLMKRRSPLADNDNFGQYSFLSTRILAEDVARAAGAVLEPAADLNDDFRRLWNAVGSPRPFLLKEDVFRTAAQRDVFSNTLLELPDRRFSFAGMHVLGGESSKMQLCFAVFLVDLTTWEVAAARAQSEDISEGVVRNLELVDVTRIFDGSLPVNRFTRERGAWIRETCLD